MTDTGATVEASAALEIEERRYRVILEHLREWLPNEGCGLIAMSGDRAVEVYPGTNVMNSPVRYEMAPKEVFQALREIDDRGWRLGAIFHSHPSSEPYPSATDLELMFDPNVYMMIVSFAESTPRTGVFRYDGGEIHCVPLKLLSDGEGTDQ